MNTGRGSWPLSNVMMIALIVYTGIHVRIMKRPKKKNEFTGILIDDIASHEFNKACDRWEKYIRSIGGIVECMLLHEEGCQCQNDE